MNNRVREFRARDIPAVGTKVKRAMSLGTYADAPFGSGDGDLRPKGAIGLALRFIVGAGLLVWGLAIWKAVDLLIL